MDPARGDCDDVRRPGKFVYRLVRKSGMAAGANAESIHFSTGLILVSSVTMTAARRQLEQGLSRKYQGWLLLTLLLGFAF